MNNKRNHRLDHVDAGKYSRKIGLMEDRKRRARENRYGSIWHGLGMIGLIGWSVGIPALLGVLVGVWIDTHYHPRHSWTLIMLFVGLILGCLNAWYWVARERETIEDERSRNREGDEKTSG